MQGKNLDFFGEKYLRMTCQCRDFHGLTSLLINFDYMNSVHSIIHILSAVIWGVAEKYWVILVQLKKGASWKCTMYELSNAEEVLPQPEIKNGQLYQFPDGQYLKVIWKSFEHYFFLINLILKI